MKAQEPCPFCLGERVKFSPDQHADGWSWSSFDRCKLHPGDVGTITRIDKDQYVFLDDERGGFHWRCFQRNCWLLINPVGVEKLTSRKVLRKTLRLGSPTSDVRTSRRHFLSPKFSVFCEKRTFSTARPVYVNWLRQLADLNQAILESRALGLRHIDYWVESFTLTWIMPGSFGNHFSATSIEAWAFTAPFGSGILRSAGDVSSKDEIVTEPTVLPSL